MINDIQGYHCPRLRFLVPILKHWAKANAEIAASWSSYKEAPWWDNERASISVFAGAVWRAGGFSFEEYSDKKRSIFKTSGRLSHPYQGRVDLYFTYSESELIVEVKRVWSGYTQSHANPCPRLEKVFASSCRDTRKTAPYGQRRLAFLFALPYFRKRESINQRVPMWIKEVKNLDYDALAWVFPSCARYLSDGKYYCPGAALLIKEVKR
jgi:hypothetical protein